MLLIRMTEWRSCHSLSLLLKLLFDHGGVQQGRLDIYYLQHLDRAGARNGADEVLVVVVGLNDIVLTQSLSRSGDSVLSSDLRLGLLVAGDHVLQFLLRSCAVAVFVEDYLGIALIPGDFDLVSMMYLLILDDERTLIRQVDGRVLVAPGGEVFVQFRLDGLAHSLWEHVVVVGHPRGHQVAAS